MARLFCGHVVLDALYGKMCRANAVRCPSCGMSWRGWNVIMLNKGEARREMFQAEREGREEKRKR